MVDLLFNLSLRNYRRTPAHGGDLVDRMLKSDKEKHDAIQSCDLEIEIDERQTCDVQLLMQGGFSPLTGFMNEDDYQSVIDNMRLKNGLLFGLVISYLISIILYFK